MTTPETYGNTAHRARRHLFAVHVRRYWPLWAVYTLVLFFLISAERVTSGSPLYRIYDIASLCTGVSIVNMIFAVFFAAALFHYLMNPRAARQMHALPLKRDDLFAVHCLSGGAFILVPNLFIFFLTLAVETANGQVFPYALGYVLITSVVTGLFFFALAVYCAMATGHTLAHFAFYVALNCAPALLIAFADWTLGEFWYGYPGGLLTSHAVLRLVTPIAFLYDLFDGVAVGSVNQAVTGSLGHAVSVASLYCLCLAALIFLLSLGHYRGRKTECAGEMIGIKRMRPVFRIIAGLLAGFGIGWILYSLFFNGFGAAGLIIPVVLCTGAGAMAADMLLSKSVRVFQKKRCLVNGIFCAVLLAALLLVKSDPAGFQTAVPNLEEVSSVTVENLWDYPYDRDGQSSQTLFDGESIEKVRAVHRAAAERPRWDGVGESDDGYRAVNFTLTYTLKNGHSLKRTYRIQDIHAGRERVEGSLEAALIALINDPGYLREFYLGDADTKAEDFRFTGGNISPAMVGSVHTSPWVLKTSVPISAEDAGRLTLAFLRDIEKGNAKRYLYDGTDYAHNVYESCRLELYCTWTDQNGKRREGSISLCPEKSDRELIAVLDSMGVVPHSGIYQNDISYIPYDDIYLPNNT